MDDDSVAVVLDPIRLSPWVPCEIASALRIGRRVIVTGMAGAGKSTFARQLSAKAGLPVIDLDVHFWKPGWVQP